MSLQYQADLQKEHDKQHRNRKKEDTTEIIPDPSCLICHPVTSPIPENFINFFTYINKSYLKNNSYFTEETIKRFNQASQLITIILEKEKITDQTKDILAAFKTLFQAIRIARSVLYTATDLAYYSVHILIYSENYTKKVPPLYAFEIERGQPITAETSPHYQVIEEIWQAWITSRTLRTRTTTRRGTSLPASQRINLSTSPEISRSPTPQPSTSTSPIKSSKAKVIEILEPQVIVQPKEKSPSPERRGRTRTRSNSPILTSDPTQPRSLSVDSPKPILTYTEQPFIKRQRAKQNWDKLSKLVKIIAAVDQYAEDLERNHKKEKLRKLIKQGYQHRKQQKTQQIYNNFQIVKARLTVQQNREQRAQRIQQTKDKILEQQAQRLNEEIIKEPTLKELRRQQVKKQLD